MQTSQIFPALLYTQFLPTARNPCTVWLPAAQAAIIISACTKLSQQGLLKHTDFCVCTTYKVGCQSPREMTRRGDLLKHEAATTIHPALTAASHPAPLRCFSFSPVPSQEAGSLMAHPWLTHCPVSPYRGQRVGGDFTLSPNHAPRHRWADSTSPQGCIHLCPVRFNFKLLNTYSEVLMYRGGGGGTAHASITWLSAIQTEDSSRGKRQLPLLCAPAHDTLSYRE